MNVVECLICVRECASASTGACECMYLCVKYVLVAKKNTEYCFKILEWDSIRSNEQRAQFACAQLDFECEVNTQTHDPTVVECVRVLFANIYIADRLIFSLLDLIQSNDASVLEIQNETAKMLKMKSGENKNKKY